MINWDLYRARLQQKGITQRDRIIERQKDALLKQFFHSPADKYVLVGENQKHMIIKSSDAMNQKTFIMCPGEDISIGDIVVWKDLHWLVIERDFDDEITVKGKIVQCNRQIKWQNSKTKQIIERWCLITKPYTSNVTNGTQISVSNREYKVQLPYDEETKLIDLDKRFMLESIDGKPRTYSCTSVDQQTNVYQDLDNGFIIWNLSQDDAGQPGDNLELMICNYEEPENSGSVEFSAVISGPEYLRAGLGPWVYSISDVVGDASGVWKIAAPEEIEQYVYVDKMDALSASIFASCEAIGSSIELHYVGADGSILACKVIEVIDIYG